MNNNINKNSKNSEKSEVENFYDKVKKDDKNKDRKSIFSIPFRMQIIGASGSMKTNTALNILKSLNGCVDKLYVCCRDKSEPLYEYLEDEIPPSQLTIEEIKGEDTSNLPKLEDLDKEEHTVIIYDDLVLLKDQSLIEDMYIRGRKKNVSTMYLTQEYFGTSKVIRLNCNYTILKKVASERDMALFMSEFRPPGMEPDTIKKMYRYCTRESESFMTIAHQKNDEEKFYKNYPTPENMLNVQEFQ